MKVVECRNSLSDFQKELLQKIAASFLSTGKGILGRDLYREHGGRAKVIEALKALVGIVFEVEDYQAVSHRIEPTFLGLLVSPKGLECESKLVAFLKYLEVLYKNKDDRKELTGEELEKVLKLSKAEAFQFFHLIERAGLYAGSSYNPADGKWTIQVFRDIDDLLDWPSKLDFIHQRAIKFSQNAISVFISDRHNPTFSQLAAEDEEDFESQIPSLHYEPNKIFISYSHKDRKFLDELLTHLKPLERKGLIAAWSDKEIAPGSRWQAEILAALDNAKVAIMMVSRNFLASDFIHEYELGPLLKKAKLNGVKILWIPVRACSYEDTPLKDYQAVISPEKPLALMKAERDIAWVKICEEIKKAVEPEMGKSKSSKSQFLSSDENQNPQTKTSSTIKSKQAGRLIKGLEIKAVTTDPVPAKKHPCQIRVCNLSKNQNADNLRVELVEFKDELDGQFSNVAKVHYHPALPLALKSAAGDESINPGDGLVFTVFNVEMGTRIQGQPRSFIATFNLYKSLADRNSAIFHEKTAYHLKLAASARKMPRIEREFDLTFSDENGICRINLISKQEIGETVKNGLIIHQAKWAIEDKSRDVTDVIRQYLIDKKVNMPCEISVLGDPRPGLAKILTIDYSFGGKKTEKSFSEHTIISESNLR